MNSPVVIVAGGTGGIGSAVCDRLDRDGYRVVSAARWATSLPPDPARGSIHQVQCDVTVPTECRALVERTLKRFGRVDSMVYAAIGYHQGAPESHDASALDHVFSANVYGAFYLSAACFSLAMKQAGSGSICFIGSAAASAVLPGRSAYCASKAALAALGRALAVDWAYANVRVNSVTTSYVATALEIEGAESGEWGHSLDDIRRRTPLGRPAWPNEIAAAVAWIIGREAAYVTGTELHVDGGWSAWSGFGQLGAQDDES